MPPNKNLFDLIAIDCDGTLLDSQKNIPTGTKEVFEKTKVAGIEIVPITGRNIASLNPLIASLNLGGLMIGSGGSFIADRLTGRVIEKHTIPIQRIKDLIQLCRKINAILFLEYIDHSICDKGAERFMGMENAQEFQCYIVADLLQNLSDEPTKAMVVGDIATLNQAYQIIQQSGTFTSFFHSSTISIDILPDGVNKGTGLRSLAAYKQIPLDRIAVIGDWMNDLEMFKVSGFSIAMGNAPAELKGIADLVAPSNDEGGAAWALDHLLNMKGR